MDPHPVPAIDGRALTGFARNRIGLVVLHPTDDAGRAVRVRHTDGGVTAGSWPTDVSPHQPFRDVAGFEWSRDGLTATLSLGGDVFETEDQRNWSDGSYKTFCTPLRLPFPVEIKAGTTVSQRIELKLRADSPPTAAKSQSAAQISIGTES